MKKEVKIEEEELMSLLNSDLKQQIHASFTGRILLSIEFLFKNFKIEFLSVLSSFLIKKSYSPDDNIIKEGEMGAEIYFITEGRVTVLHKLTHTYLTDLYVMFKL